MSLRRARGLYGSLLFSASFQLCAAPVTFNTALPVSRGEGVVRVQVKYLSATTDPGDMNRALTVKALPLVAAWGATSRWTLFGIMPLYDKTMKHDMPSGRRKRSVKGLGDVTTMVRYTAYSQDQPGRTFRIAPFAGIEMPTGKENEQDMFGQLPGALQLGAGAWNPLVGIVTTAQSLKQEWGFSASYKFNNEANNFEHGDEARLELSYHQRVWVRVPADSSSLPHFLYVGVESNWVWQSENQNNGQQNPDSGGATFYLAPTLQYITHRTVADIALQLPVVQNLNGNALEQDFIFTLSLRLNY
ncbi:MAG: transporter [Gammaproteobacteria bacterium]|nr:transporter [Gammaproteobacteria bacterium]